MPSNIVFEVDDTVEMQVEGVEMVQEVEELADGTTVTNQPSLVTSVALRATVKAPGRAPRAPVQRARITEICCGERSEPRAERSEAPTAPVALFMRDPAAPGELCEPVQQARITET